MSYIARNAEAMKSFLTMRRADGYEGKTDETAIKVPDDASSWAAFFEWWDRTW